MTESKTDLEYEIRCYPSGDIAHADDAASAIFAAKTLCEDDAAAMPIRGRERKVAFYTDGVLVFGPISERNLYDSAS